MKNVEFLQEGWVKFTRFPCKEGNLDKWQGDCIDNPNNESKNPLNLNSSAVYWRFDNNPWINDREIGRHKILGFLDMREEYSAKEIWEALLKRKDI